MSRHLTLRDKTGHRHIANLGIITIDKDGNVRVLLDNLNLSNGLEWSVSEKRFYHTDSGTELIKEYDFDKVSTEFQTLVGTLMTDNQSNSIKITTIVDRYLGKGKKVGDCKTKKAEIIDLINQELRELLKK